MGDIGRAYRRGADGFSLATIQEAAAALDGEMFAYMDSGNFALYVMVRTE